jgi:hypothetical protein
MKRTNKKKQPRLPCDWRRIGQLFLVMNEETTLAVLWKMLKEALCSDDDAISSHDRSNMLFVYENIKELLQHIQPLLKAEKKKLKTAG